MIYKDKNKIKAHFCTFVQYFATGNSKNIRFGQSLGDFKKTVLDKNKRSLRKIMKNQCDAYDFF